MFQDLKRMTVALTRAKKKLILIGALQFLKNIPSIEIFLDEIKTKKEQI